MGSFPCCASVTLQGNLVWPLRREKKQDESFFGEEIVGMHSLLMVMVFTQIHNL